MNMPKIPFLLKQYNDFDRDLNEIAVKSAYAFPHLKYSGATVLNTVQFLSDNVDKAMLIATKIDNWAANPAGADINMCEISDELCDLYGTAVDAGNTPVDSSNDPRDIFNPESLRKIVSDIIRIYGFCEVYEKTSLAKMLRGCVTILLNGGILPVVIGIYPAVLDGDVPNVQTYAEDPNTQAVEPKLAILAEMVAEQIHFSDEEKADIIHAEEVKRQQEHEAEELTKMVETTRDACAKAFRLYEGLQAMKDNFKLDNYCVNLLRNTPMTKKENFEAGALAKTFLYLGQIRAFNGGTMDPCSVIRDIISGAYIAYAEFSDKITPYELAVAIPLISPKISAYIMESHTPIDANFSEPWTPSTVFVLCN